MRVGILGGGQLAWMLGLAAQNIRVDCRALTKSRNDPAHQSIKDLVVGDFKDSATLKRFFEGLTHCTFENEFVEVSVLREFEAKGVHFFPSLDIIQNLQNKKNQKKLLSDLHIATSAFETHSEQDLLAWAQSLLRAHEVSSVFKWSQYGYDGKGTLLTPNPISLESFVQRAQSQGTDVFFEEKISFIRECAQLGVRSSTGEIQIYPLVESVQKNGICHLVYGPASALKISSAIEILSAISLKKILNHLNYVGVLAVEFFETDRGVVLVNELAPRVHNSGHYTQDAGLSMTSQFENHLRAGIGMPLGSTQTQGVFGMINLVGKEPKRISKVDPQMKLYDYGKSEVRLDRKMGHINFWDVQSSSIEPMKRRMNEWQQKINLL